jgi:hypothetical protein
MVLSAWMTGNRFRVHRSATTDAGGGGRRGALRHAAIFVTSTVT